MKTYSERSIERINGHPVRCYDNGGKTADRYTVCYLAQPYSNDPNNACVQAIGMDDRPFHPQGIGQHTGAVPGPHLGRRIKFRNLPEDCRKAVLQDLKEPYYQTEKSEHMALPVAYTVEGKSVWHSLPGDQYLVVGKDRRSRRVRGLYDNAYWSLGINLWNGKVYLLRNGKRYVIKTVCN